MGRKKKCETQAITENTNVKGEAGSSDGGEGSDIVGPKKAKRLTASKCEMEKIWPGLERCMVCGFAWATVNSKETYIDKNGVERPVHPKEDKLHNSYHGKFYDALDMYGPSNFLTYKVLRSNLQDMEETLRTIKDNDIVSDISDIPTNIEFLDMYAAYIKKWYPCLEQAEKDFLALSEKHTVTRSKELDEWAKAELEKINAERAKNGEPPLESSKETNSEVVVPVVEAFNNIGASRKKLQESFDEIERVKTKLSNLYKKYDIETIEEIVSTYKSLTELYVTVFLEVQTLKSISGGEEFKNVDFESIGFEFDDIMEKILNMVQIIPNKQTHVNDALHKFFSTEYTRSIRLWDMGKPHPRFEDFCKLLWNTPKFLNFIKPYMTEYQYMLYTRNNKANRKLVDYKFDDAPYYFGNVTESDICYECRKDSKTCRACDSLESVEKCYTCDYCTGKNGGVADLSYIDDLIIVETDAEDIEEEDMLTEEEYNEVTAALEYIGSQAKAD